MKSLVDFRLSRRRRLFRVCAGILSVVVVLLVLGICGDLVGIVPARQVIFVWMGVGGLVACAVMLTAILSPGQGAPVFTRLRLVNLTGVKFKAKTEQVQPPLVEPKPPAPEVVAPPGITKETVAPPGSPFYGFVEALETTLTWGSEQNPMGDVNDKTFQHALPPGFGAGIVGQEIQVLGDLDNYVALSILHIQRPENETSEIGPILAVLL